MTHTIHKTADAAAMKFDLKDPCFITISGAPHYATYTIDPYFDQIMIAYFEGENMHHVQISSGDNAYPEALKAALAYYRQSRKAIPMRDEAKDYPGAYEEEGCAWKVFSDEAEQCIKITFDNCLAAKVQDCVKASGWRWSPMQGCWVKKLTIRNLALAHWISSLLYSVEYFA